MQQNTSSQLQKTDEAPDPFELLRQQHGNAVTYIRFYIQQDNYLCFPIELKELQQIAIIPNQAFPISLPLNQLIYNTINDILIESKFIYANSKIMNSILQSGKEIQTRHVKKHNSWVNFLNRPQFKMIKTAFQSLRQQDQAAITYSVLAISNLILKLGINISKLSCIMTQRKLTTKFLAIPTLSILFLQSLMFKMLENKEINLEDEEGKSQFIRQMPKITYIKMSEFINKQELYLMEVGEYVFFNSQAISDKKVRNMQYLQFYQHEQPQGMKGYQKITSYEHIKAINIRQLISKRAPYGFELLFMFRMIYFPLILDFNPDAIIFVQDYENSQKIIDPQVRALLLAQMMQYATGKVFVMRQVGPVWKKEIQLGPVDIRQLPRINLNQMNVSQMKSEQSQMKSEQSSTMSGEFSQKSHMEQQSDNVKAHLDIATDMNVEESYRFIQIIASSLSRMNKQIQAKLDAQQFGQLGGQIKLYETLKKLNHPTPCYLSKVHSILRADLSYISLALIQRSSFEEIVAKSHQYIYSPAFVQNLIHHISLVLSSMEQSKEIHKNLQLAKEQLKQMMENMKLQNLVLFNDCYDSVYVIPFKKSFRLKIPKTDNQFQTVKYYDQDHVHVFYGENKEIFVFLFRFSPVESQNFKHQQLANKQGKFKQNTRCLRLCIPNQKNLEYYFFQTVFHDELLLQSSNFHNSTFLVTGKFIYRAFGRQRNTQTSQQSQKSPNLQKSQIMCAEYSHLLRPFQKKTKKNSSPQIQTHNSPKKVLSWTSFTKCFINQPPEIPLMQKQYGWAVYDYPSKNAIFAGGYAPHGQFRINKYMHIFGEKDCKIKQIGKTSSDLFQGAKLPKAKIPLFPFIYGISFLQQKSCIILNTNGFFQCFTNNNKLFLTELRFSQNSDQKIGILWQQKLHVKYEDDDERLRVVATKQFVINTIVNSYKIVNCYRNTCVLQTLQDGIVVLVILRLIQKEINRSYSIKIQRKELRPYDFSDQMQKMGSQQNNLKNGSSMEIQKEGSQEEEKFAQLEFRPHDI